MVDLRAKRATRVVHKSDIQPQLAAPGDGRICIICAKNRSSYCCPQCFVVYCSSSCFQSHNIDCTESFSKGKVQEIISYEKKAKKVAVAQEGGVYVNKEENMRDKNNSDDFDHLEDDSEYSEDENESDHCSDAVQHILEKVSIEPSGVNLCRLDLEERKSLLASVRHATISVKLLTPWWENDSNLRNIHPKVIELDVETPKTWTILTTDLKTTLPALKSILMTRPSSTISYHVLGLLLGHVLTVRSLNCDLNDDSVQAINILSSSTPVFIDPTFKPQTVAGAVELWLAGQPSALQRQNRKCIRIVLEDVLKITASSDFVIYAIFECWVVSALQLGLISTELAQASSSGNVPVYSDILPVLLTYVDEFRRPKSRSKKGFAGSSGRANAGAGDSMLEAQAEQICSAADSIARKSFFLLLYCLESGGCHDLTACGSDKESRVAARMAGAEAGVGEMLSSSGPHELLDLHMCISAYVSTFLR